MNRYLTIPEEDILTDPESAGAVILRAASRTRRYGFQALVPLGETLLIVLSDEPGVPVMDEYIFSPLRSSSADAVAAEINQRFAAGQRLLASFPLGSALWGLYGRLDDEETLV